MFSHVPFSHNEGKSSRCGLLTVSPAYAGSPTFFLVSPLSRGSTNFGEKTRSVRSFSSNSDSQRSNCSLHHSTSHNSLLSCLAMGKPNTGMSATACKSLCSFGFDRPSLIASIAVPSLSTLCSIPCYCVKATHVTDEATDESVSHCLIIVLVVFHGVMKERLGVILTLVVSLVPLQQE
jgi:hypothetical protein